MNAFAFRSSRFFSALTLVVAAGAMLVSSGCGSKSKAAAAQTPPPQTLSEPVRPAESEPVGPSIPVAATPDSYTVQRTESRELPQFVEPAAPPMPRTPVAASAAAPVEPSAAANGGRYHTMAKGETLYALSRQYNVNVKQIIAANNFKDPNRISVGTKVYIP